MLSKYGNKINKINSYLKLFKNKLLLYNKLMYSHQKKIKLKNILNHRKCKITPYYSNLKLFLNLNNVFKKEK